MGSWQTKVVVVDIIRACTLLFMSVLAELIILRLFAACSVVHSLSWQTVRHCLGQREQCWNDGFA